MKIAIAGEAYTFLRTSCIKLLPDPSVTYNGSLDVATLEKKMAPQKLANTTNYDQEVWPLKIQQQTPKTTLNGTINGQEHTHYPVIDSTDLSQIHVEL